MPRYKLTINTEFEAKDINDASMKSAYNFLKEMLKQMPPNVSSHTMILAEIQPTPQGGDRLTMLDHLEVNYHA